MKSKVSYTRLMKSEALYGYIFIAPNLILYAIFFIFPALMTFVLSFTSFDLFSPPSFVGTAQYVRLFNDPLFHKALLNTLYFALARTTLTIVIAFWLALLLNRKLFGRALFRTMHFLPYVSLLSAVALVWTWLFATDGLINTVLGKIGIKGPMWLTSKIWAMPAIIVMSTWKDLGYSILIFLAGFQTIPSELYEAAMVDGANWFQRVRNITLPLSTPAIFFAVVTTLIGTLQDFDQFYFMTKGGPAYATTTLSYYIYEVGFKWFKMGYACAASVILFLLVFLFTLIQWYARRRWVFEG